MRTKHEAVGFIKEEALPKPILNHISDLYYIEDPKRAVIRTYDLLAIRKPGASIPNHDDSDPDDWFEFMHDDVIVDVNGKYLCFLHTDRRHTDLSRWVADAYLEYVQGVLVELPVNEPLPRTLFGKIARLVREDSAWAFIPDCYLNDPDVVKWRLLGQ